VVTARNLTFKLIESIPSIGLLQVPGQVNVHSLDACVVCKGVFTKLATDTRLLVPTERQLRVEGVVVVHPNCPSMQPVCSRDGSRNISREDRGSQAILIKRLSENQSFGTRSTHHRVISYSNNLILIGEHGHDHDGTKYFFLNDRGCMFCISKDGWLDKVPLGALPFSSKQDLCATFLSSLNITYLFKVRT
jgi:hypothetical protein